MSSYSDIQIINNALYEAGCDPISSLTEQTQAARVASQKYAPTRDEILSKIDWNFARMEFQMTPTTGFSQIYQYAYQYPADCLAFRYFVNPFMLASNNSGLMVPGIIYMPNYPYGLSDILTPAIEDVNYQVRPDPTKNFKIVYTQLQAGVGIYTAQITNPSLFSDLFRAALEARMSAIFAAGVRQDDNKYVQQMQIYASKLADAEYASGKEETEDPYMNNPLADSRN